MRATAMTVTVLTYPTMEKIKFLTNLRMHAEGNGMFFILRGITKHTDFKGFSNYMHAFYITNFKEKTRKK